MFVKFWGTRGSLPASGRAARISDKLREALTLSREADISTDEKLEEFVKGLPFPIRSTYGTNTSCVEIGGTPDHVICDCGSGLRDFGGYIMGKFHTQPQVFHIFMSHLHWDHLMGFPFFVPAYVPGNKINFYSLHEECESAFRNQQNTPCFPVPIDFMAADIEFHTLEEGKVHDIAGFKVSTLKQNHPGVAWGYCFERDGQKIVYSTDSEHTIESNDEDYPFIDFFRNADVLIFDAQYELFEAIDTKASWGHSSNIMGVELAVRADVRRLCLYHNEHTADDEGLEQFLEETKNYLSIYREDAPLEIFLSYDGLTLDCEHGAVEDE